MAEIRLNAREHEQSSIYDRAQNRVNAHRETFPFFYKVFNSSLDFPLLIFIINQYLDDPALTIFHRCSIFLQVKSHHYYVTSTHYISGIVCLFLLVLAVSLNSFIKIKII